MGIFISVALLVLESVVARDLFSCNFAVIENYYNGSRWLVPTDTIAIEVTPYGNLSNYIGYEFRCTNGTKSGLYNISVVSYDYQNQDTFLNLNNLNFNITGYYCGESYSCGSIEMNYFDRATNDPTGTNCSALFGTVNVQMLTNSCQQYTTNLSMFASDCSAISYYNDYNCTIPNLNYSDNCLSNCISNSSYVTTTTFQTTGVPQSTSFSSYCNAVSMSGFAIPIGTCAYKQRLSNYNESWIFQCDANGSLIRYSYSNLNCTGASNMTNVTTTYEDQYVCNAVLNCTVLTVILGSTTNLLVLNNTNNGVSNVMDFNSTCTYDQYQEVEIVSNVCISGINNSSEIIGCNSHGDIIRYSYNSSDCFGEGFIDVEDFSCPKCSGQTINQLSSCPSAVIGSGTIPLNYCISGVIYSCSDDGLLVENVYSNSNCSGTLMESISVIENEWFCGSNSSNSSNSCNYFSIQINNNECSNGFNYSSNTNSTSIFLTDVCTNLPNGTSTKYTNCTNNSINYHLYSSWNCSGSTLESRNLSQCVKCLSSNGTSATTATTTTAMPINKTLEIVNWVQWNGFTFPTEVCVGAINVPLQLNPNQSNIPNIIYSPASIQFFCLNADQQNSELLVAVYGYNDRCNSDDFHLYYGSELGVSNYSCSGFDMSDILNGEISFMNSSRLSSNSTSFPKLIRLHGYKNLLYANESLLNSTKYNQGIKMLKNMSLTGNSNNDDSSDSSDSNSDNNNNKTTNSSNTCRMKHEYIFLIFPETCVYDTIYNVSWKLMSCNQSSPIIHFYTNSSKCDGNYTLNHDLMNCFTECNGSEDFENDDNDFLNSNKTNDNSSGMKNTRISVILMMIIIGLTLLHL